MEMVSQDPAASLADAGLSISNFASELFEEIDAEEAKELQIEDPTAEGFSIKSEKQANYFIRRLKKIQSEKAEAARMSQEALNEYTVKVQRYLDGVCNPLNSQEEFFLAALHEYALKEKQKDPKKKTFKMIEGTLAFKKQVPEYLYDDDALKKFLKEDKSLEKDYLKEKTTYTPDKVKIKADGTVNKTGQLLLNNKIVTGITVTERPEKFEVK